MEKPAESANEQATERNISRRRFLKWAALGLGTAAVAGAGYSTLVEPWWIKINKYDIPIPDLPPALEGLRIVHLSDLHVGAVVSKSFIEDCARDAAALNPDLVCITGDFVTRHAHFAKPCCEALSVMKPPLGTFAVPGNHDNWAGGAAVMGTIRDAGIKVLINDVAVVETRGAALAVAGLDDLWTGCPRIDRVAAKLPAGVPNILMMHNPDLIEEFGEYRFGFVMAGHMHGGQVQIPLIGTLIVPSKLGAKYAAGFYEVGVNRLYVHKGVGLISPPVRFGTRPEIALFVLKQRT
ncbi:MAG: metallophosphoesterase [Planctomycetota bacterium]|nr:metallophosphoesterase [Planctomycetota bacterium]